MLSLEPFAVAAQCGVEIVQAFAFNADGVLQARDGVITRFQVLPFRGDDEWPIALAGICTQAGELIGGFFAAVDVDGEGAGDGVFFSSSFR